MEQFRDFRSRVFISEGDGNLFGTTNYQLPNPHIDLPLTLRRINTLSDRSPYPHLISLVVPLCQYGPRFFPLGYIRGMTMVKKKKEIADIEPDYSLNDLLLRGRVSDRAIQKELPSGDTVVEFRLIITKERGKGVDTLDIAAWSAKARRSALSLKPEEWIEVSGSVHRRFFQSSSGLASRWQVEAIEIARI